MSGHPLSKWNIASLQLLTRTPFDQQISDPVTNGFFAVLMDRFKSNIEPWIRALLLTKQAEYNASLLPSEHFDFSTFDMDFLSPPTITSSKWYVIVAITDYHDLDIQIDFDEWIMTSFHWRVDEE
jgi:hypothetical protein